MERPRLNDSNFLRKVTILMMENISNEQFSGNELAETLFLSREQTHRKIKALTSLSTGRFIRYIRILQGLVYLQSGNYPVSEVAFKVGFDDPAWFSKCFREELGVSPVEIKKTGVIPASQQLPIFSFYQLPEVHEVLLSRKVIIDIPTAKEYSPPRKQKWFYAAVLVAIAIVSLLLLVGNGKAKQKLHVDAGKRLAVLPYSNQTGDSSLRLIGDMAGSWISSQLAELDSFQIVPWFTVKQYENYIGVLPGDPEHKPLFRELVSADYLISGDYFLKGDQIYFNTRFIDARTSAAVCDLPVIHGLKDSVMTLIEDIRLKIAGLMTNLEAVKLGKLRPPNLEAYRYYLKGMEELNTGLYFSQARKYFEMSVQREPNFVEPRIFLTWTYGDVKQDSMVSMMLGILNTPGITRYEKSVCETWSAVFQRQHNKALKIALSNLERYPKDYYFNMLAGYLAKAMFMPGQSIKVLNEMQDPLQSDFGMIWHYFKVFNYTESLMMLGKLDESVNYLQNIPDEHYNLEIPRLLIYAKVSAGISKEEIEKIIDSIGNTKVPLLEVRNRLDGNKLFAAWYLSAAWEFSLRGAESSARYFARKGLTYLNRIPGRDCYGFDEADALFLCGDYRATANLVRKKLKQKPQSEDLWIYLAQAEAALGNARNAFAIFNRFESKTLIDFRRNEYPYQKDYIKARIHALLNQKDEAVALIKSALEKGQLNHYCDYRRDIFLKTIVSSPDFLAMTAPR